MVAEVRFYHLQRQTLEVAFPKLLERVLDRGLKACVRVPDPSTLESLDRALWTYDPVSFLPHGTKESGFPERQPAYLTMEDTCPNGADTLILINAAPAPQDLGGYQMCLYMFDGQDEDIVGQARADWLAWKEKTEKRSYWQQKEQGSWEQKA
ncbi:DNA polymerase III subunit chi [Iodidimonas gelatinilytica]|uniref:DNA polymerase III subunit chi n=1 Tax=Iodidimonas gelatinilytica TaxID=1236966 RepID=A0A5A7MLK7_9PROT|nr:DNA polymerase III subunit chi [Iodidimonas gelatinilytica]GEQ96756.1 DNA polymerase III subunit chi [Iodidimonas gelatinilytica]